MVLTSNGNPRERSFRSQYAEMAQANARLKADNSMLMSRVQNLQRKCDDYEVEVKQLREHIKYAEAKHGTKQQK